MFRETFKALLQSWRLHRISAARERLYTLLATTPRYWRSMAVGGGSVMDLGRVTRAQAIKSIESSGATISHVDDDEAFIAVQIATHSASDEPNAP